MLDKVAIFGVGKYGSAIARKLVEKGAEIYAFDSSERKIENIKEDVALAVTLDATDKKALLAQQIEQINTAIVAIGENFEATILCSVNLLELGVKRIIARANDDKQRQILERIGITEVLLPEEEVAFVVAERIVNPSIVSFLQLPDDYEIAEIRAPKNTFHKTVDEVAFREKYQLTVVTLKREFESKEEGGKKEEHIVVPTRDTVIQNCDTLVMFGTTKNIERFLEVNK